MEAHLLRDLGPRMVHDDHVALPILRCLVPAQGALVLIRDSGTVLARLGHLYNHSSPFLPGAAFRSRAVLFDPVEFAEGGLAHREPDLRLPRRPLVQGNGDDPRPDLVADPKIALRVLPDEPLSLFVHVNPIVHDLRDVQEAVQRTETHESAELKDFHYGPLDDLLEGRSEDQGVVLHPLIHRAVAVDDAPLAHPLDIARDQGECLIRPDLAFQGRARELARHRIHVLLGLITITFFAGHASVRNPCAVWVGPHASPDTVQSCIQYFGVNQPVWDQYKNYIANLFQGNWGKDPQGGTPVLPVILTLFPATIELLVSALFLMIVVGIPLGVIAANNSGRWPDHLVRLFYLGGWATPRSEEHTS